MKVICFIGYVSLLALLFMFCYFWFFVPVENRMIWLYAMFAAFSVATKCAYCALDILLMRVNLQASKE